LRGRALGWYDSPSIPNVEDVVQRVLAFAWGMILGACGTSGSPLPGPAVGPSPETLLLSVPRPLTRLTSAELHIESTLSPATFLCSLDQAPYAPCPSPVRLSGLAIGPHLFRAYAVLDDGRFDPSPAQARWEVSDRALATRIVNAPAERTASTDLLLGFTAADPEATFECALDSAGFSPCATPLGATGLSEGAHHVEVRAIDADGVRDPQPARADWIVDLTPPRIAFAQTPAGVVEEPQATFAFTASEERVRFFCSMDRAAPALCESPYTASGLAAGAHAFSVLAEDAVGWRSAPALCSFEVRYALGATCAQDADCHSGFCSDGVCCNERCDGICRSCSQVLGTCSAVRSAVDPDSCTAGHLCDVDGVCREAP
jgi:hypothetical protein